MLQSVYRNIAANAARAGRNIWKTGLRSDIASKTLTNSWPRSFGTDAMWGIARGANWTAKSAFRSSGVTGALLGGAYGAASDDTSVLGGAFMGAGLGIGGLGAVRGGAAFGRNYRSFRPSAADVGPRMGMGRAAYRAAARTGAEAKQFFGAQLRANSPFRNEVGRRWGNIKKNASGFASNIF